MVQPREAVKIIGNTLRRSPKLPEELSYIFEEPDSDGEHAAVSVPVIVLQDIETTRDDPSNTNLTGYLTNDADERVGKIYETKWEMDLEIDIWTAARSDYNADRLGDQLHEVLYAYDTRGPGKVFRDENGEPRELIYDFSLRDSGRNDNIEQTPSVRIWRQNARVRGAELLTETSDEPPVRTNNETVDTN